MSGHASYDKCKCETSQHPVPFYPLLTTHHAALPGRITMVEHRQLKVTLQKGGVSFDSHHIKGYTH